MDFIENKQIKNKINEEWRDIPDYEGIYKVSSHGRIYSMIKNRILNPTVSKDGYKRFYACKNGKHKSIAVHRAVALAFLPNSKEEVNHIDGDKTNNDLSNLEWVTRSENITHMYETLGKGKIIRPVRCIETEIIYESCADACRKTGIYPSGIRNVVIGKKKSAGGYSWERC